MESEGERERNSPWDHELNWKQFKREGGIQLNLSWWSSQWPVISLPLSLPSMIQGEEKIFNSSLFKFCTIFHQTTQWSDNSDDSDNTMMWLSFQESWLSLFSLTLVGLLDSTNRIKQVCRCDGSSLRDTSTGKVPATSEHQQTSHDWWCREVRGGRKKKWMKRHQQQRERETEGSDWVRDWEKRMERGGLLSWSIFPIFQLGERKTKGKNDLERFQLDAAREKRCTWWT